MLLILPTLLKAQSSFRIPAKPEINRSEPISYPANWGNLKTTATATCPTNPVGLAGQDTLGNAVANGHTFACNNTPFFIYVPVVSGNIASPCIETEYTPFHTAEGTHGTETFYEGGTSIGCIGPAGGGCSFPIGQGAVTNTNWGLVLSLLDPNQQHDFVFCRNGSINNVGVPTTTITLIDCWTGAQLPSSPASALYSNANPPNTATCFTMTLPANTDIGTAAYSITPTVAPSAFIDLHDGEAYVNSPMLAAGTYTVGYTFNPPASSGCGMVTGNFTFTITNITPTVTVNSPFVCAGGTDTLRANGATTYSWTPSSGLSATTGSVVAVTPTTSPTNYTVTGTNGACSSTATSTVTITSNPAITATVSTGTICAGVMDTLTASGANTYTWSPSTNLSSANGSTVTATPTVTTTYTITGSVGTCSATPATVTITVNPTPTVTVNSATLCTVGAGTATLTANGATTYSWSPSTGLSTTTGSIVVANPTVTTTYTVTGTSSNCSSIATSTVSVYSMPTFTVNKATICSGNKVSLIASDATLSYTWTPAASLNTTTNDTVVATPSTTTVYTITGSNPACPSLTITDSVIVNLSPTVTVLSPTVCSGTSATITAVGATSYTWSPQTNLTSTITNDTVYINNPTTNLTYTAYGTGANGCTDSAVSNVIISNHLGIYSGTPIIKCFGTPFGLGAIGASTYTWTSNDPANLNFGADTSWAVQSSVANVGTYTLAIYGESHSGTYCNGNDTVYVTINPTPTVTAVGNTNPAICAGDSVSLTVTSTGPPVITYGWFPSTGLSVSTQSTVMASPSVTTVYTAIGTAADGCAAAAGFTVSVIPVPSFTVNSTAFCLGGSDSLKVVPTTTTSGAQTYSWTPSAGLSVTTGTAVAVTEGAQGVYPYTVTGTNTISTSSVTCSSTASSTVIVIPLPTVTVSPAAICAGSTATLTAGGTATTYTWSSPSVTYTANTNTLTDSPAATTTYTVTGTGAGGCTASATTTITVNDVPTFTIGNNNQVFCLGDSSAISIVPTSTVAATYTLISSGGLNTSITTSITVHPSTTTIYTVNATANAGGCPAAPQTTTVTVNQPPTLTVTPTNTTVCAGNMAALTVSGASTYTWSSSSTTYTANSNALIDAPSITATYSVTGQDAFGCHAVNTATATIIVTPVPIASASVNSPICKGQTIDLSASTVSGTATYSWTASNGYTSNSQNPTIPNATATNTATYSLTVSEGGCTSAPSVITVLVNNPPIVSVSPSTVNVCPGTTVTYTASGASTYVWNPSAQTGNVVSVTPATTTVYSVTGTDANNCSATATATVNIPTIAANMTASPETGDAPLAVQFVNLSTNASTYVWNYGNGNPNQTTNSVTDTVQTNYPNAGTYTVTLIASNTTGGVTCSASYTLVILVTEGYSLVIPNIFTPNGDAINDNFMVKGEGVSNFSMDIFDRWGLKMFSSSSINTVWDGKTAGGKDVPADTYFYLINATSSKTNVSKEYKGYLTLIR